MRWPSLLLLAVLITALAVTNAGASAPTLKPSPSSPALVLLSTADPTTFRAVVALARDQQGEVTLAYPPNAFIALLSPAAEVVVRQHPAVVRIARGAVDLASVRPLRGQAESAAHAWHTVFQGIPDPIAAKDRPGPAPERPDSDVKLPPPERPAAPIIDAVGAPISTQTSEFMAGSVAVSVVFVESSGGAGNCFPADPQTENWDAARQATVLAEISDGLAFWTSRANRPSPLTFILDDRGTQPTSCEPINRTSSDEGRWIGDALTAMGFPANPGNYFGVARSFANARRTALGADWGYTIFVVDSLNDPNGLFSDSSFAYAYLNGPFLVMTYDNDGWGISRMNLVTAHETGHIFGALDEYASSGCSTADTWGYLNVANASCNNGGVTTDFSIMGEASEQYNPLVDVSTSARRAVGWRNPGPGAGVGAVVDVVRTATAALTPFSPNPSPDQTPTYAATADNSPFPPGGCNTLGGVCHRTPAPATVSRVAAADWNLDGGAFTTAGAVPSDGAFDEETDPYTFTPPAPVSDGAHTFGTRSTNQFGHFSIIATDTLTIQSGGGNALPAVNAGPDATINEGGVFTSAGSFTDPDVNTWSGTVDYGDGSGVQPLALNLDKTFSLSHLYADNGTYTVTTTVTDNHGGSGPDTAQVTVNNLAPSVNAGLDQRVSQGDAAVLAATFTDPGLLDNHTATIKWGDGSPTETGTVGGDPGTVRGIHTYPAAGTYSVSVTVTDDDGGASSDILSVIVIKPRCDGIPATIVGTNGPDIITGTPADDVIVALDGSDYIDGAGGHDRICAGLGNDLVFGGLGDDRLFGDAGHDVLDGGDGNDPLIDGGSGNDLIFGRAGNDQLKGNTGNDQLLGGADNDTLLGDAGNDALRCGDGVDTADGGPLAGTDTVQANCETQTNVDGAAPALSGLEAGLNQTVPAGNAAVLAATFIDTNAPHTASINWGDGTVEGVTAPFLEEPVGDDPGTVYGIHTYTTYSPPLKTVTVSVSPGSPSSDGFTVNSVRPRCNGLLATIVGSNGPDVIDGTAAADVIVGLNGGDLIRGLEGNDTICAGLGNDLVLGGDGADWISGDTGNDVLDGGVGSDTLDGSGGNDGLFGGAGDDSLFGGEGNDSHDCGLNTDTADGGPGTDTGNGNCETQISIP